MLATMVVRFDITHFRIHIFFNLYISTTEVNNDYGLSLQWFRMTDVITIMNTKSNLKKFSLYLIENKKRLYYIDQFFNVV